MLSCQGLVTDATSIPKDEALLCAFWAHLEDYKVGGRNVLSRMSASTLATFDDLFRRYHARLQNTLGEVKVAPWMKSKWEIENGLLRAWSDGGEYFCSHLMTLGRATVEALMDAKTCRSVYHDANRYDDFMDPIQGLRQNEGFHTYDVYHCLDEDLQPDMKKRTAALIQAMDDVQKLVMQYRDLEDATDSDTQEFLGRLRVHLFVHGGDIAFSEIIALLLCGALDLARSANACLRLP
ncbi:hypothetical protein HKX48_009491 [Thoreauomyces humboldtii]|nr:hypothetical protein HKX48_009491 [Thoreauomyces humboldtii]